MTEHDSNHKGNIAELAFAAEAARLNFSVLKPLTEHEPYDLVLGVAGRFLRVQCKWGTCKGDVICVRLKRSRHSPTRGYVVSTYQRGEVDAFGIYCGDLKRCYLVPIEHVEGAQMMHLRLAETRNKQRAALHWASDYEFSGAVAQLAERVAGSDEARGSNPLSSIATEAAEEVASNVLNVGAHQFRNHFGHYMEQAAKGVEVLVSRHGRPFVRLLGPTNLRETAPEPAQQVR